eukprot:6571848-Lingulodinium_polyedra.AAC.1
MEVPRRLGEPLASWTARLRARRLRSHAPPCLPPEEASASASRRSTVNVQSTTLASDGVATRKGAAAAPPLRVRPAAASRLGM